MTSVIYGPKSRESFAKLGQDGSWEKTSEGSLASMMEESLEPFSGTWPAWGIASGGDAMELTKPQELHNAGTESLLSDTWRTPSAGDPKGGVMEMREGTSGKYKVRDHAANWKTPTANKLTGGTRKDFSEALIEQVANWPTPVANDEKGSQYCYSGNGIALKLPGAAIQWPHSPQAQQHSSNGQESSQSDQTSLPRSRPTKRLNYKFSLWLMGFPEDWL